MRFEQHCIRRADRARTNEDWGEDWVSSDASPDINELLETTSPDLLVFGPGQRSVVFLTFEVTVRSQFF